MKDKLFCFVGKSGAGKDTIVNKLCDDYGYKKIISYTTRIPRDSAEDLKSHIFADVIDYTFAKRCGDIVAETVFDGNRYWTTKSQLDVSDIYILDLPGLKTLHERYSDKDIVAIYITASDTVLKERMEKRGDSDEAIEKRIKNDEIMFKGAKEYPWNLVVHNNGDDSLDYICQKIYKFMKTLQEE